MTRTLSAAAVASLASTSDLAENIGVSGVLCDGNILTVLRNGMIDYADGVDLQVENARDDVGKQLNRFQHFVASGVDAIIVDPVDADAPVAVGATDGNDTAASLTGVETAGSQAEFA